MKMKEISPCQLKDILPRGWGIVFFLMLVCGSYSLINHEFVNGEAIDAQSLKANLDLPYSISSIEEEEEDSPEIITFFGGVHEAEGVFFCLDQSESMATNGGWKALQRELVRVISNFSEEMDFGLVFFGKTTTSFPANKKALKATKKNKQAALNFVNNIKPESWTCMLPGMKDALKLANSSKVEKRRIIVLSDGKPTCNGINYFEYVKQILDSTKANNTEKVKIDTVGTGSDVNVSFMIQLALDNGGRYRFAQK